MNTTATGIALLMIGAVGLAAVVTYAVWVQVWKPRSGAGAAQKRTETTQAIPRMQLLPFPRHQG